jgi:putative iron-regulated protein
MFAGSRASSPFAVFAFGLCVAASPLAAKDANVAKVLETYADIAQAGYEDSLATAKTLQKAVETFIDKPTEENMKAARQAWIAARVPYMQTEAYRFGNPIVDDWEGKVNAWPLDEGLIDYVAGAYGNESPENDYYVANVIANEKLTIGGKEIDASKITKAFLAEDLQEAGGVEANVATGYHAVEFLLWGQDLNGTGPGAGKRPATDYDIKNCSNGHCDRRAEYLSVVTDLLVDDLAWMAKQWADGGDARKAVTEAKPEAGLTAIMTGLGSLSYGELAGERMKLGLMIHDPEEEHDCFSDTTYASHLGDAVGIRNVYTGSYKRVDGSTVSGPSVSDLVKAKAPEVDKEVTTALNQTVADMDAMAERAKTKEAYDQMIGEGNDEGNAVVQKAIDALLVQTKAIERAVAALELNAIEFEGSESLDAPDKVKKAEAESK